MIHKIALLLIFSFASVASSAQVDAIDRFFSSYEEDPSFTVVYVSPKMFQMISKVTGESEIDADIQDVVKDLKGLKILTTELNALQVYKDAKAKIQTSDYEILLTARDEGQNVQFLTKTTGDIVNELLLLVGGDEEFVLMSFVGDLDLDKIARLASKLNLDGAEHLGKLKAD